MRTVISSKVFNLNPQRDITEEKSGAWCLCPIWMGWMPWLVDGVDAPRVQERNVEEISRTGRHCRDCHDGL